MNSNVLSKDLYDLTNQNTALANQLAVLGPPIRASPSGPNQNVPFERLSVHEVYSGKTVYLENSVSAHVADSMNPFLGIVLPI